QKPHLSDPHFGADKVSLRSLAQAEIDRVVWVPEAGRNRINGMIESRPDWVVSRQRAWGVPITIFRNTQTEEIIPNSTWLHSAELMNRIEKAFCEKGADVWFEPNAKEYFLKGLLPNSEIENYEQVKDVLDVWFDSGSTHAFTLEDSAIFPSFENINRASLGKQGHDHVMYLEGSDQHRGWFQSSLLESCGTRSRAPYDIVLTHGFVLDEKGQKMSKSLGNVVSPQDVIAKSGADILRLWVAASDFSDDLRIGPEILKTFSESYRKLRNTLRWMLGALSHYQEKDVVPFDIIKEFELERLLLHWLFELDREIREAYRLYDYRKVITSLSHFMNTQLSAFYFDIRKDTLYCEPPSSEKRKSALTVVDLLLNSILKWLAPILSFTCEEAWSLYSTRQSQSIHLQSFSVIPQEWSDPKLSEKWESVRLVRRAVTGALELERADKKIGSSLEAAPIVYINDKKILDAIEGIDMAEICITSGMEIRTSAPPKEAIVSPETPQVGVVPQLATGKKCARSWRITRDVGLDPAYPELSARDAAAIREIEGLS
ncbi:MAG: class I tRNA ligase family protein, partial [Hyphomicrobium sp.]